ncbi:MAG: hypothetical protein ABL973_10610 [Micropepsaceae bacterium]
MDTITVSVTNALDQISRMHWAILVSTSMLFLLFAALSEHRKLRRKFGQVEALLLERSIGTHSRNWTATALNLEKKAQEPGEVARSSALTYLHLLDEAAEAWLKGSQWQDALRVTQHLLIESCHAIGKPGIGENEFRASADLIENKLSTYADLSKAANEAAENAIKFLGDLDQMLSIHDQPARLVQLRDQVAAVGFTLEAEHGVNKHVHARAS